MAIFPNIKRFSLGFLIVLGTVAAIFLVGWRAWERSAAKEAAIGPHALLTYKLLPGSSITPCDANGAINGEPEPLSGTIVWKCLDPNPALDIARNPHSLITFRAQDLHFHSKSFEVSLDHGPQNDVASDLSFPVYSNFCEGVVVNEVAGFHLWNRKIGRFSGSIFHPSRLFYHDMTAYPVSGGANVVHVDLKAVRVDPPLGLSELAPPDWLVSFSSSIWATSRLLRDRLEGRLFQSCVPKKNIDNPCVIGPSTATAVGVTFTVPSGQVWNVEKIGTIIDGDKSNVRLMIVALADANSTPGEAYESLTPHSPGVVAYSLIAPNADSFQIFPLTARLKSGSYAIIFGRDFPGLPRHNAALPLFYSESSTIRGARLMANNSNADPKWGRTETDFIQADWLVIMFGTAH
jgi:hypothetical protein